MSVARLAQLLWIGALSLLCAGAAPAEPEPRLEGNLTWLSAGQRSLGAQAAARLGTVGPFALEWRGRAAEGVLSLDSSRVRLWNALRLRLDSSRKGAWLEAGDTQAWGGAFSGARPAASAGIWIATAKLEFSATLESRYMLVPMPPKLVTSWTAPSNWKSPPEWSSPKLPYWEGQPPKGTVITSLQPLLTWHSPRWQFQCGAGLASGQGLSTPRWMRVEGVWWMRPGVGLGADLSDGLFSSWPTEGLVPRAAVALSLHLAPGRRAPAVLAPPMELGAPDPPSPWSLLAIRTGEYEFSMLAPGSQRVSVRGDWTDWEEEPMVSDGGGRWSTRFAATPGPYHVEVRVDDGAWVAPPGMPTVESAYGGNVGLLAIP